MQNNNQRMENEHSFLENSLNIRYKISETKNSKIYQVAKTELHDEQIIKIFKPSKIDLLLLNSTLQKMNDLPSSNIIKIVSSGVGTFQTKKKKSTPMCYIIMEKAKGEFFDYILNYKKGFTEQQSKVLFYQIIKALNSFEERGLVCSPIKANNILLDANYRIKISDFVYENITPCKKSNNHTELASLLFSMVTGRNPLLKGRLFTKKKMSSFWLSAKEQSKMNFTEEFIDLINKLFLNEAIDKSKGRNLYENIMNHPWLKGVNDEMIISGAGTTEFYKKIIEELKEREGYIKESIIEEKENERNEKVYRSSSVIEEEMMFIL